MWIVRVALERPYTFIVLAIAILIIGPLTILKTPTDVFPNIDIPVVSIIWSYTGLPPDEMSQRIVSNFERGLSTTVTDIEHIESQSLNGIAVIKVFFHQGVNVDLAMSQITSIGQAFLRNLPPGTTPPFILNYNASTVPIIQLALSSKTMTEQQMNDLGFNFVRTQLATVQGAAAPYPYGGKQREINVDLNLQAMQTYGVTPADINAAIDNQNLILPSGTEKIGLYEYDVKLNGSPTAAEDLNDVPVKTIGNSVLYIRDVAHVRDGFSPQTNIVRINGHRAVLMTILKIGRTSTLDIIDHIKQLLPAIRAQLPPALSVNAIGDQSIFVKAAIDGVVREGVIAALLTSLMILLFLGSWRSTLAIVLSIPLAILTSIICLSALGETINIMTLGGLALAVGILVDDATVTIENINSHLEDGAEVKDAILEGANQIAVPALVSTLCICIVFVPMFFLTGVAHYLFVPLAEAVVFAMLASYMLSRTLVPTLALYLLKKHNTRQHGEQPKKCGLAGFQEKFEHGFRHAQQRYRGALETSLDNGRLIVLCFLGFIALSLLILTPWLGEDFFPTIDAGQMRLHFRAHSGTRIEETASINDSVDAVIRQVIPEDEIDSITDNIGVPNSGINLSYSTSLPVGPGDSDILISLKPKHTPVPELTKRLRVALNEKLPGLMFAFLPADIVGQILNFGLPAPIDVQVVGKAEDKNRVIAQDIMEKMRHIPGIVDAHVQQEDNYPELHIDVDRSREAEQGLTQSDVAHDLLIALSGSFQTAPTFWLDRKTGVSYNVVTQAPQYRMNSLEDLRNIPVSNGPSGTQQILGSFATLSRAQGPTTVTHYNVQPVYDVFASVQDRDLGGVSSDVEKMLKQFGKDKPKDTHIVMRGQTLTQQQSFHSLYLGLLFSIVLVYLLIVVNFQSWLDPFIIVSALPAAIAGIVWMLFITHTTLSVPALTGAIMCIGVATANSILVISFAREHMQEGNEPRVSALEAGFSRLRPVLMTALAMIIGMAPMALGLGEGGEQNAPLGRAVIGGLLFSTVATLFFVPVLFTMIHTKLEQHRVRKKDRMLAEGRENKIEGDDMPDEGFHAT
jgi:CzcA family heavy metal efflux pump